jgi:oxygen-independent coproporphyrinogen III oxidase
MKVLILTQGCSFHTEIERLTHLFFQDCELTISPEDGGDPSLVADLTIRLRCDVTTDQVTVTGELDWRGPSQQATHSKQLPPQADHVTQRKRSKQAVLHVLHQLLEHSTGEHQPWGILTGIRPLKLVHGMRERGMVADEIRRQLLSEYLISPERTELLLEIADVQSEVVQAG